MTRDVDAIRADLAARTVGGMASSSADRDIAALLAEVDRLRTEAVTATQCLQWLFPDRTYDGTLRNAVLVVQGEVSP